MAWYDEAVFYHIYPLGLLGAPKENAYSGVTHRLNKLKPWIEHIKEIGCNALYIGPLFESVGHGYETTDYRKLDSRLGDNNDLQKFVKDCHKKGIRVILDGVFNHTGRDFFAFRDLKEKREGSKYRDWYCNVNFYGNNEYNDGFSYDNWGGYNLLVKLNQRNPEVKDYISETIRFWVQEFDIDGLRLDAADVLDFDFMKMLRAVASEVKPEFYLMGEVIHGDYSRWVNEGTLHSVTNYVMHKAFYSGHNDHNYFEIAHTQRRLDGMGLNGAGAFRLYNFVDNHDVERIFTKLQNKAHFTPVHILLYTMPGIPSVYYGSEFALEGKKEKYSDTSLRPALDLDDFKDALKENPATKLIAALGRIRQANPELSYGDYKELFLTNRQYAFSRSFEGRSVIVTVNNDDGAYSMTLPAFGAEQYMGALSGERVSAAGGNIEVTVQGNSGEIWVPSGREMEDGTEPAGALQPVISGVTIEDTASSGVAEPGADTDNMSGDAASDVGNAGAEPGAAGSGDTAADGSGKPEDVANDNRSYSDGIIAGLQEAIIAIMEKNGPVTDQMRRDVYNNTYHDSLITWIKSFR